MKNGKNKIVIGKNIAATIRYPKIIMVTTIRIAQVTGAVTVDIPLRNIKNPIITAITHPGMDIINKIIDMIKNNNPIIPVTSKVGRMKHNNGGQTAIANIIEQSMVMQQIQ